METDIKLKKYKIAKGISFRKILDEFVIVNSQGGEILTLNESGGRIFELLQANKSIEEIIAIITDEFETTDETVNNDTTEYINSLIETGIVTEDD